MRWQFVLVVGLTLAALGVAGHGDTIRVMTFNLRYASAPEDQNSWKQWDSTNHAPQRRQFVVRVITNRAPDVIGFQEGEDAQLDYLAANLPGYAFQRQKPSGGGGNENAAFGYNTNTVDLLDRGVFSLGPSPGGGYWNNPPGTNFQPYLYFTNMGLNFPRLALWGKFRWKATGHTFLFYTTHFDFNNYPQIASARLIVDDALSRAGRMPLSPLAIVVGDFNSNHTDDDWALFTGSYTHEGITGDFTDAWQQVHGTWTGSGTFHGWAGGTPSSSQRIDWILCRGGCTATQAVVVTDSTTVTTLSNGATATMYPSDHYPVFAVLRWPEVASDYDGDGLPDSIEHNLGTINPVDADSDGDGLLDGEEDLDGDGVVEGGEADPASANAAAQRPTDIRHAQMDGILDYDGALVAENNGMSLYVKFDGRYLYVATWDAGEGQDHFIFVVTNPNASVSAPWAKSGTVPPWIAYLADENDNAYASWFGASGSAITNSGVARSATYFENGGRLEGVLDLAAILGAGFTQTVYIAVAPYATADGGTLQSAYQVPAGNGDGNLMGATEFYRLDPGDTDHDGVSDYADPDSDADGMPDAWEEVQFGDIVASAHGDEDGDGATNLDEWRACTDPANSGSVFRIEFAELSATGFSMHWSVPYKKTTTVYRALGPSFSNHVSWTSTQVFAGPTNFPFGTNRYAAAWDGTSYFFRVSLSSR